MLVLLVISVIQKVNKQGHFVIFASLLFKVKSRPGPSRKKLKIFDDGVVLSPPLIIILLLLALLSRLMPCVEWVLFWMLERALTTLLASRFFQASKPGHLAAVDDDQNKLYKVSIKKQSVILESLLLKDTLCKIHRQTDK